MPNPNFHACLRPSPQGKKKNWLSRLRNLVRDCAGSCFAYQSGESHTILWVFCGLPKFQNVKYQPCLPRTGGRVAKKTRPNFDSGAPRLCRAHCSFAPVASSASVHESPRSVERLSNERTALEGSTTSWQYRRVGSSLPQPPDPRSACALLALALPKMACLLPTRTPLAVETPVVKVQRGRYGSPVSNLLDHHQDPNPTLI